MITPLDSKTLQRMSQQALAISVELGRAAEAAALQEHENSPLFLLQTAINNSDMQMRVEVLPNDRELFVSGDTERRWTLQFDGDYWLFFGSNPAGIFATGKLDVENVTNIPSVLAAFRTLAGL